MKFVCFMKTNVTEKQQKSKICDSRQTETLPRQGNIQLYRTENYSFLPRFLSSFPSKRWSFEATGVSDETLKWKMICLEGNGERLDGKYCTHREFQTTLWKSEEMKWFLHYPRIQKLSFVNNTPALEPADGWIYPSLAAHFAFQFLLAPSVFLLVFVLLVKSFFVSRTASISI